MYKYEICLVTNNYICSYFVNCHWFNQLIWKLLCHTNLIECLYIISFAEHVCSLTSSFIMLGYLYKCWCAEGPHHHMFSCIIYQLKMPLYEKTSISRGVQHAGSSVRDRAIVMFTVTGEFDYYMWLSRSLFLATLF